MLNIIILLIGLTVDSKVDSVIIYSDRVLVTRVADIYLDKATEIIFPDLPGAVDDASVRVKAAGLRIGEVQVKQGYEQEPQPRVKELQKRIEALEMETRILNDEIAVLKDKEKFLQSIALGGPEVISKEIITGKVAPESWRLGLKFMTDELIQAKKRQLEIEHQRQELNDKINNLKRELDSIRAIVENRKNVAFDCHPEAAKTYTIQLHYLLHGAYWKTYYEIRANPSAGKISFTYYAKVGQRTNEDWYNTRLVLSTAKPALGGTPPSPTPWSIYLPTPVPEEKEVYKRAGLDERMPIMPTEAAGEVALPVEAGISIIYPLPGRYTMESGEPEKKIAIYDAAFNAEFDYFIMPRISQLAYAIGRMQNSSKYLFLAGEASTYVGDDFTGRSYLQTTAPEESIAVSLGIDERLKVKRELKKSKVSKGGLFSNKTKYEYTYENTVGNFHDKAVNCTIVDQIPISQSPDIKVSNIKFSPEPTSEEKDLGIHYWSAAIKPGSEYRITVSFTVEAPANREIQGLVP